MNWKIWIVVYMILTALWATFAKLGRLGLNGATTSIVCSTTAFVSMLIFNLNYGGIKLRYNLSLLWVVMAGICGGMTSVIYYRILKDAPLNNIQPLTELYLVFIPLLAFYVFKEKITNWQILGMVFGAISFYCFMK